jgi:hypothetical protein
LASETIDWIRGSLLLVAALPNVPDVALAALAADALAALVLAADALPALALLFSSAWISEVSSLEESVLPVVAVVSSVSSVSSLLSLPSADSSSLISAEELAESVLAEAVLAVLEPALADCSALSNWLSPPLSRLLESVLSVESLLGSVPASAESSTESALVPS